MKAHPRTAPSSFRAELGATARLAVPLAAANLLQMAVYAIDVIFVARLGEEALAASSLAIALFGTMQWCFSGLTSAVAPLIAAERGRRRHALREIRRSLRMALWLALACGLAGMAMAWNGEAIMLALGQDPGISRMAGGFLDVLLWSLVPMVAANVLRMFVSAMGRPVLATLITGLALLVNAIGNYAFVFGGLGAPALGLEGSALSSCLTALVTLLAYILAIQSDRMMRRCRVFGGWWRPDPARFALLWKLGLPIALITLAEGGLFSAAAFLMGWIGAAELAGHTVALQVAAFFFQIPFGIGQAATIRVGYHYGAGNRAAIGQAGWAALVSCLGFQLAAALAMLLAPRAILSVYVDVGSPASAATVRFAVQYLAVAAAFQLFDGIQAVIAGALRGLQDTRRPMLIAVFSYWLPGFGTAIALGFFTPLAGVGVWIGLATGLVFAACLLLWRWHGRERLRLVPA